MWVCITWRGTVTGRSVVTRLQIRILTMLSWTVTLIPHNVISFRLLSVVLGWQLCLVILCNQGEHLHEKLMLVIHVITSDQQPCDAVLRSSDVQSGCILLFTMLHYLLTSVTKSERLLALEIFLSYDMCIWRKLFLFFCWQMLYWLFFCIYWGLLQFCLLYYLSSFFFRYHFLKLPIIHNVYCLN